MTRRSTGLDYSSRDKRENAYRDSIATGFSVYRLGFDASTHCHFLFASVQLVAPKGGLDFVTVSLFALCEPAIRRPCPLTELSRVGTALRDSRPALTTNASTAAEVSSPTSR